MTIITYMGAGSLILLYGQAHSKKETPGRVSDMSSYSLSSHPSHQTPVRQDSPTEHHETGNEFTGRSVWSDVTTNHSDRHPTSSSSRIEPVKVPQHSPPDRPTVIGSWELALTGTASVTRTTGKKNTIPSNQTTSHPERSFFFDDGSLDYAEALQADPIYQRVKQNISNGTAQATSSPRVMTGRRIFFCACIISFVYVLCVMYICLMWIWILILCGTAVAPDMVGRVTSMLSVSSLSSTVTNFLSSTSISAAAPPPIIPPSGGGRSVDHGIVMSNSPSSATAHFSGHNSSSDNYGGDTRRGDVSSQSVCVP